MCVIHSGYIHLPTVIYFALCLVPSFQPLLSPHFFHICFLLLFVFFPSTGIFFFFSYRDSKSHFTGSCSVLEEISFYRHWFWRARWLFSGCRGKWPPESGNIKTVYGKGDFYICSFHMCFPQMDFSSLIYFCCVSPALGIFR